MNEISKIPFFLVTGFLGSGKTTFIKKFLDDYSGSKKIAVIQNEFAPASIDGLDLKTSGYDFEMMEINQGSVFCVCLLSDFVSSLSKFVDEQQPDVVIMEASGLSDPIALSEMFQMGPLHSRLFISKVWCVIDAVNFLKMHKMQTRLDHQLRVADVVIINKTDIFNGDVEKLKLEIKEIAPFAEIKQTEYCNIATENLFSGFGLAPVAERNANQNAEFESCGRPDISIAVIKSAKLISEEKLDEFIQTFLPKIYRMKGYVNLVSGKTVALQCVFDKCKLVELEGYKALTQIIAMGDDIRLKEFSGLFRKLAG